MKHLCLTALILVPILGTAQELKPEALYKRALPSVMTLSVEKPNSGAIGSAFFAIKDGLAVTAWHVVSGATSVAAKFSDGQTFEVSGLVDKDERRDVAIVRVKVFGRPLLPLIKVDPEVGSKAYVIGAPKGLDFSVSDGLLSQVRVIGGVKQYQFSCPTSPGNSGGPLINSRGEVVGVVSWQVVEGQNLNFAVPAEYVRGLDITLPTIPWDQVKPDQVNIRAITSQGDLDQLLATGIKALYNTNVALTLVNRDILMAKGGYEMGVPSYLYSTQEVLLDALKRLSSASSDEPNRADLLKALKSDCRYMMNSSLLVIECIHSAQNSGGGTASSQDMYSRAMASIELGHSFDDDKKVLKLSSSDKFVEAFPLTFRRKLGLAVDPYDFDLGVMTWVEDDLLLLNVKESGLGYRLGFRNGDAILNVNGHKPSNLQDVKHEILLWQGSQATCVVSRYDEKKKMDGDVELWLDIPRPIPKIVK